MAQDRDYGRNDRERPGERDWRARSEEGPGEGRSFGNEGGYARQGGYGEYGGDYARQQGEAPRGADFDGGYARYGGYGGYDAQGGYGGYGQDYAPGQEAGRRQQNFRGRGPKGYRRSDERIREDVNDRLADDPWLDASEIEIQVTGGEVIIGGAVGAREDKRRAEAIVERVLGVEHVQNNLRIQAAGQGGQQAQTGQTDRA